MRSPNESDPRDVSRWSLWLVALACLGPLAAIWLLGALMLPVWVAMVAALLTQPEAFTQEPPETIWHIAAPIAYVVAGGVGLVGVLRVLTVRRERPKSHRYFTIGMVAVGLTAVLIFDFPWFTGDLAGLAEPADVVAFLVYFGLPVTGTVWLLAKSWRFLLADPARADGATPRSRIAHERRDDWRLDA